MIKSFLLVVARGHFVLLKTDARRREQITPDIAIVITTAKARVIGTARS